MGRWPVTTWFSGDRRVGFSAIVVEPRVGRRWFGLGGFGRRWMWGAGSGGFFGGMASPSCDGGRLPRTCSSANCRAGCLERIGRRRLRATGGPFRLRGDRPLDARATPTGLAGCGRSSGRSRSWGFPGLEKVGSSLRLRFCGVAPPALDEGFVGTRVAPLELRLHLGRCA